MVETLFSIFLNILFDDRFWAADLAVCTIYFERKKLTSELEHNRIVCIEVLYYLMILLNVNWYSIYWFMQKKHLFLFPPWNEWQFSTIHIWFCLLIFILNFRLEIFLYVIKRKWQKSIKNERKRWYWILWDRKLKTLMIPKTISNCRIWLRSI